MGCIDYEVHGVHRVRVGQAMRYMGCMNYEVHVVDKV